MTFRKTGGIANTLSHKKEGLKTIITVKTVNIVATSGKLGKAKKIAGKRIVHTQSAILTGIGRAADHGCTKASSVTCGTGTRE